MHRSWIALIVVLGGLAVLPASAPAQARLSPAQFEGIDAVYVSFAAFENGATIAERAAARAACTALGSTDALLSALRRACLAQLKIGQTIGQVQRCEGRSSCLVGVRAVQRAATQYLALGRAANRIIAGLGLVAECSRELRRSAAELLYVTRIRSAYALLEHALRIQSPRLAKRAERRLQTLQAPDSRTAAEQHEAYRAGCAPA